VPNVLKSGSLNLLEPSGPVQACNGIAFFLFPFFYYAFSRRDVSAHRDALHSLPLLSPSAQHRSAIRTFHLLLSRNIQRVFAARNKNTCLTTYIQTTPTQQNIFILMPKPKKETFVFCCSLSIFCPSTVDCVAIVKIPPGKSSGHLALPDYSARERTCYRTGNDV